MGSLHSTAKEPGCKFKAKNIDQKDNIMNSVVIKVKENNIVVRRKRGKKMATWPVICLRRYGCTEDLLFIEVGHYCDTGPGMYLFKCKGSEKLFELIKNKWNRLFADYGREILNRAHVQQNPPLSPQSGRCTLNHEQLPPVLQLRLHKQQKQQQVQQQKQQQQQKQPPVQQQQKEKQPVQQQQKQVVWKPFPKTHCCNLELLTSLNSIRQHLRGNRK